jgi:hypothetical protein
VIQVAMAKAIELERLGVTVPHFGDYALSLLRSLGATRG